MNLQNVNSEVFLFLVGQLGVFIWWASKMNTKLGDVIDTIKEIRENGKDNISAIWKKFDELKARVEEIEKSCIVNHRRKTDQQHG